MDEGQIKTIQGDQLSLQSQDISGIAAFIDVVNNDYVLGKF